MCYFDQNPKTRVLWVKEHDFKGYFIYRVTSELKRVS